MSAGRGPCLGVPPQVHHDDIKWVLLLLSEPAVLSLFVKVFSAVTGVSLPPHVGVNKNKKTREERFLWFLNFQNKIRVNLKI